ncbi:CSLREA domain-containing protein [Streptomyces sp. NPDC050448]|uniref:CSLREA domain-containing protein n=1 Tax=Streptomyces sp. NPDC050448 TaxID=3155404 RepID=UPI00342F3053
MTVPLTAGLLAGTGLVGAQPAYASTLTVTTTADLPGTTCGSPCSLRQAIGAANAAGGSNTITFAVNGVFTLTTGTELHVTGSPQQHDSGQDRFPAYGRQLPADGPHRRPIRFPTFAIPNTKRHLSKLEYPPSTTDRPPGPPILSSLPRLEQSAASGVAMRGRDGLQRHSEE